MKRIKFSALLLALIFIFVGVVGCGQQEVNTPELDEGDLENLSFDVTAEISVGVAPDPKEKQMINSLASEFNQIYPNVTVKTITLQNEYLKEIGQRITAGTVPDIIFATSETGYALISNGHLENLEKCIAIEEKTNSEWRNQFYESFMKFGQKNYNGDQYVLPRSADRVVTHINKRILREAGVDMTKVVNGWTWEDFLDVCESVRTYFDNIGKTEQNVIDAYINWEAVMYPIMRSFGVEVFDKDGNVLLDKNNNAKAALDLMKNLVDKRYIAPPNVDSASGNYEGGQGAMMFHSASAKKYYDLLGEDYDLVTFPLIGNDPKIGAGLAGYGISSYSSALKKAVAWKFLSFMMTKEGQEALADGGLTSMPIRKDLADYTTNKWGKGLESVNLAAYSYKPEYNIASDFFLCFPPENQSDIIQSLADLVTDYCSGSTYNKVITEFKNNIENYT